MSWFVRGDLWSLPTAFDDQSMFYSDDVLSLHREGYRASMETEVEEFMFDEGRDDQWHS